MAKPYRTAATLVASLLVSGVVITSPAFADTATNTANDVQPVVDAITTPTDASATTDASASTPTRSTSLSEREIFSSRSRSAIAAARLLAPKQTAGYYTTSYYARWYASRHIAQKYGWDQKQFGCLNTLWAAESSWRPKAVGGNNQFLGIPQLARFAVVAAGYTVAEFRSSPELQVQLGAKYIKYRKGYGTPCKALAHFKRNHWY